jgi:hypothetical protein
LFIKQFAFDPTILYPDFNCNNEIYINGDFLEIESLGPLTKIQAQGAIEHTEHWLLARAEAKENEGSVGEHIFVSLDELITQLKNGE